MTASQVLRPIGFRPEEISAMVNEVVVEQHAEEAAFLWSQRDRAVAAPNFRLKDLARLDERVEAHLDGLRVAGQFGWKLCEQALAEPGPGEVFAASVLAFEAGDQERIATVLKAASSNPKLQRGVVSALGWLPHSLIENTIPGLYVSNQPASRCIAIAAWAIHRKDPAQQILQVLSDPDLHLRARALKACGELGKMTAVPSILSSLSAANDEVRFFAAWSAARLGNRSPEVIRALRDVAVKPGRFADRALDIVVRAMALQESLAWQRQLRAERALWRLAALAAGSIGDPALIPDLLELMKVPTVARPAGAAFSLLTGVDLAYLDLDGEPPPNFEAGPTEKPEDENVEMDSDGNLPWPVPARVADWWKKNGAGFSSGKRYLLGKQISDGSLRDVLLKGFQPQRAAAALELGLLQPSQPLFEVRARGGLQQNLLQQWKS